jgi:hypothetical protein
MVSISGGYMLYKAIFKRARHLLPSKYQPDQSASPEA